MDPYLEKFGGIDPMEQLEGMLEKAGTVVTDTTALLLLPETALQERSSFEMNDGSVELLGLWENDLSGSMSAGRLREFQRHHPNMAVLAGMSSNTLLPRDPEPPVWARPLPGTDRWYASSNAAMFLVPDGAVGHYRKSKLVAGVELMPFERYLGPLGDLALDLGGTTGSLAGQSERSVLEHRSPGLRIAPVICYESVFGEHVAAHVRNGANLIAILTNDAWWGDSPGFRQHLYFAPIRAIENRRSIARSANTGISGFVDQRGVLHERIAWWTPGAARRTVALNEGVTFFTRSGDIIGRMALILTGLLVILLAWRRLRAG